MPRSKSAARAVRASAATGTSAERTLPAVDLGPLDGWIGFRLRLAQNASFQAFSREAQDVDLSPGRFSTLLLIGRNPGISQTALSRAVGSDKSTLTFALDGLIKRGLVRRTRLPQDRRTYCLSLTSAGERMLAKLSECAKRHDRNLDRIVGLRDRATFLRILKKLVVELA